MGLVLELARARRRIAELEARLAELEGQPSEIGEIEGSSPRTLIEERIPSPAYLEGKMPTYNIDDLIEHLEFRILIHETYAGSVVENPSRYPPRVYGSYDYQIWAIEGYENAIFYARR